MKTNFLRTLLPVAMAALLSTSASAQLSSFEVDKGGVGGGGGDINEMRVDDIRSDLTKWILRGGAKDLKFNTETTYEDYLTKMSKILKPGAVDVTFVENDDASDVELMVKVNGKPKTCRGFYSKKPETYNRPKIVCNISRFTTLDADVTYTDLEAEQYRQIHHEFAGLVNLEKNEGLTSDYYLSNQITAYLEETTMLRLAVKKVDTKTPDMLTHYEKAKKLFDESINNPSQINDTLCSTKSLDYMATIYTSNIYLSDTSIMSSINFCSSYIEISTGKSVLTPNANPSFTFFYGNIINSKLSEDSKQWSANLRMYISNKSRRESNLTKEEAKSLIETVTCTVTKFSSVICHFVPDPKVKSWEPRFKTFRK